MLHEARADVPPGTPFYVDAADAYPLGAEPWWTRGKPRPWCGQDVWATWARLADYEALFLAGWQAERARRDRWTES